MPTFTLPDPTINLAAMATGRRDATAYELDKGERFETLAYDGVDIECVVYADEDDTYVSMVKIGAQYVEACNWLNSELLNVLDAQLLAEDHGDPMPWNYRRAA